MIVRAPAIRASRHRNACPWKSLPLMFHAAVAGVLDELLPPHVRREGREVIMPTIHLRATTCPLSR